MVTVVFFFFKQKTAYEMRISDWSSDVCSSDLHIIKNLPKSQASGVSGRVANAKVEVDTVPTFTDKAKFLAYVKKTGDFDLMTTGMNASAVKARWENKKKVPGIGETQIVKLSLTKVKRSEERRVGKECVSTLRYRGAPYQ